jgi:uncharacterized membrane protein
MLKAWRAFAAFALLAAIACGDDDGSGPTGSISLTASPTSLTLAQGASGTVNVTLARGGGFSNPVNVTVEGLPTGVTATVAPTQLTGTTTSALITVNVASTAAAGTYPITVRASATGVGAATATYSLTVTAVATPNYSLTATPAAVSAAPGASVTSTIGIQRTTFTGAIALTLDNPPAGITGSFNPTPATADQSVLTINVGSTVAPGSYNLTVKGSATGPGDKTTTIALTVTAPTATFTVAATPTALNISAGASGNTSVAIVRTNFTTDVALTLVSPPAGITGVFTPATLTGTTLTSNLVLSVAGTVAPGTYPITVQGTGGSLTRTATVNVTVPAPSGFTISATPAALSLAAGASGNTSVAIVRTGFTTDVALTLVNPPAGITGVFTPATLTGTTLTSTLALSVAGSVAPGTYPITVRGTGGAVTQNTTVNVTVTAAAGVTLAVNPTTLTIQQGTSGQSTLTATRTNFTGDVTPSVSGNPAGMTVTFSPTILSGTTLTSTATVNVGSGVAPGNYTLTITGGGAPANPTTTLQVSVTAPSGGNLVWEFCNNEPIPLKFWRLSNGTWAEVAPTVVGSTTQFSFSIASTSGGIAFTISNPGSMVRSSSAMTRMTIRKFGSAKRKEVLDARARITSQDVGLTTPYFDTFVFFGLASELSGFRETCATAPVQVTKNFTVTGQGAGEEGLLGYGGASASLVPQTSSYNLMVQAGTYDWLAMWGPAPTFPSLSHAWSHYRVGRGEVAPGASVAINRTGATAFTSTPFTVTGGAGGSYYTFLQSLEGARGSIIGFPLGDLLNTTGSGNMLFMASSDRLATDMNSLNILNTELSGNVTSVRSTIRYVGSGPPATTSFALPAAVPAFTTTQVGGAPVTTWTIAGSTPADYQTANSVIEAAVQGAGGSTLYTMGMTRGYATANGMSTSYTLTGPTLPGFLQAWAPAAPLVDASVLMFGSNITTTPVAGSVANVGIRLVQSP